MTLADRVKRYQEAGHRGVQFQLEYQLPDGGYIWEGYANDAYHKQPYAWALSGYVEETHRLLTWVKDNTLHPDGQLEHYNGDVYKLAWFFQGCHRLGRFDISYPVMSFLASCQTPCGGLPHFAGDAVLRSLSTCWTGVAAIYAGRLDMARAAAEWAISVLHQQTDPARFYFTTTRDGRLITPDLAPEAECIDAAKPKQCYWEVGLPMQLMNRLYQVTGSTRYLDYARRFFDITLTFGEDRFTYVGAGKGSLAAAQFYLLTGDEQARECAITFCEELLATQHADGGWRDETEPDILLIYIDHAAEFNVWLREISAALVAGDQRWQRQ